MVYFTPNEENGSYLASAYSRTLDGEVQYSKLLKEGKLLYIDKKRATRLNFKDEVKSSITTLKTNGSGIKTPEDFKKSSEYLDTIKLTRKNTIASDKREKSSTPLEKIVSDYRDAGVYLVQRGFNGTILEAGSFDGLGARVLREAFSKKLGILRGNGGKTVVNSVGKIILIYLPHRVMWEFYSKKKPLKTDNVARS